MTPVPRWWGAPLDDDQRELQAMLDDFIAAHPTPLDDDPTAVAALISELARLGVWTLGTAESAGGGGADTLMSTVVWERLGRAWPALGWAAVQAHVAVDVLAGSAQFTDLVEEVHAGTAAVAVVDARSVQVRLRRDDASLSGSVARVDVASSSPHLLVLIDRDEAILVPPTAMTTAPRRRTGLAGALTRSVALDATAGVATLLTGVDNSAARTRLRLGAAAVAVGIAGAAADAAVAYASSRHQFGAALTAIPTVRQSLLNQQAAVAVVLAAVTAGVDDPAAAYALMRAGCDGAIDIAAAALQSHGGYGYLAEYAVERHLREAVSLRAAVDTWSAAQSTAATVSGHSDETALWQDAS